MTFKRSEEKLAGPQRNINDILLEKLADSLESTSRLTQTLVSDLRESEADFASVKTELSILRQNVQGLSEIIRDGNGSTSLLTRIALIEQKIESIEKWVDNYVEIHQKSKIEVQELRNEISDLKRKIENIERELVNIKSKQGEEERKKMDSINRELEIHHEAKKQTQAIKSEREAFFIKVFAAVVIGALSLASGWAAKGCSDIKPKLGMVAQPPHS